ncbi:LTA synthase family protein [Serpentinicella sp. ANB-PHB4]|uniref:LTA synthase family protein n=1 Tax=Serpentinicella sp. ANB-PHB4 TaxID=3074076 RepID=UPI002865C0E8|nr:LTA synthase family protein [Serpentinicella sp. ANB-PHB4]MDR5658633.1 LTA synthase family protein [Serpentinicella sp. ANB-PHB4]
MLERIEDYRKRYKHILLFSALVMLKLVVFHSFMDMPGSIISVTFKNLFLVVGIFTLASLAKEKRRWPIYITINFIISMLLFIDAMYYSHFHTLVPFHSIYQIGQLGPVSDSVFALLRIYYFLLFIDCIVLGIYYKRNKSKILNHMTDPRKKPFFITSIILLLISGSLTGFVINKTEGNYTPYNLGVVNFHAYDMLNFFYRAPFDVSRAEGVIETINQLDGTEQRGYGIAKDKNIIVIQAESVQSFVINNKINGQYITPNLNKLINQDSIYFSQFFEQVGWGNTSDSEFVSHNGYHPSRKLFSYKAYEDSEFYTLPMALKEMNYSTMVFHGNDAGFWNRDEIYPSQGLDKYVSIEDFDFDEELGMGLSDGSMFKQSLPYLKDQVDPFYAFYITLTSHHPYYMPDEYRHLNIKEPYKDTVLDHYIQTVHYLDKQIGIFIEDLKKEGLYEDSIILIYGDHQGLHMRDEEVSEVLSDYLDNPYKEDEMFRVPFIIHIPDSGIEEEITTTGGQIDFFPTVANLVGIDLPRINFGKDLLNIEEGFVAKQINVMRGSFIDNDKIFIMSPDGIFENSRAWNIHTDEPVDIEDCREGYERAIMETEVSEYIMQNNLIPIIREKGLNYVLEHHD